MKATSGGAQQDFPNPPEGLHQAVLADVIDKGLVDKVWEGKAKKVRQVRFVFQIDARDEEDQPVKREDGKRFLVGATFTLSLAPNAKLLAFLESWFGKSIPEEVREEGIELEELIGRNAQISVYHNQDNQGKTWANIKGIAPVARNAPKLKIEDGYERVKDREGYDPPVGSEEWEKRQAAKDERPAGVGAGRAENEEEDDDLPF